MSGGAHCLCYCLLPRPAAMARLAPSLRAGCWLPLHHHHPPRTGAAQTRTSFISDLLDWFYILMEIFMHVCIGLSGWWVRGSARAVEAPTGLIYGMACFLALEFPDMGFEIGALDA